MTSNDVNNNEFNKFARMHQGISSTTLSRYESAVDAYINPSIIEERKLNVAQMDVFSRRMSEAWPWTPPSGWKFSAAC